MMKRTQGGVVPKSKRGGPSPFLRTTYFLPLFTALFLFTDPHPAQARFQDPAQDPNSCDRAIMEPGVYSSTEASPILEFLNKAKKTVDIEIYTMNALAYRQAVRDAIKRGIKVRLIKDPTPLGEDCSIFTMEEMLATGGKPDSSWPNRVTNPSPDCLDKRKLAQEIKASGGQVIPFNKNKLCRDGTKICFQHGKMAIADGSVALVSTGNFDATSLCLSDEPTERCNRDYTVVIDDPAKIETLKTVYDKDAAGEYYDLEALISAQDLDPSISLSPFSMQPLLDFIHSAKSSIHLQNQYLKEKTINAALIEMALKGVKVYVNVASPCAFAKPSAGEANSFTAIYHPFEQAGIQARMFTASQKIQGRNGYLHAKAIVVDEARAWVGSVNGSTTSITNNREFGVFFEDRKQVAHLLDILKADFSDAGSETYQEGLQCLRDEMPTSH